MAEATSNEQFEAGVQAMRQGDRQTAARLLREVVTADPHHEKAWLWLSGAAETAAERRYCLEQALAINPANEATRRSLSKLPPAPANQQAPKAAVLPSPLADLPAPPRIEYAAYSSFDDIWTHADQLDLCPYCAAVLTPQHKRCPTCQRNLINKFYRYDKPTPNFHVYWVLVMGLGQLMLIQAIIDVILQAPWSTVVLHGFITPISFVLTFFLNRRHFWAYAGSLILLFSAGLIIMGEPFLTDMLTNVFGLASTGTPVDGLYQGLSVFITGAVRILAIADIGLALFYGVFIVAPDFARDQVRLVAGVSRESNSGQGAFLAGERYAKSGMWASAVLNLRRATAQEPTRLLYHLTLARAYGELNFFERSLDVLQSASKMVSTPEAQSKIQEEMLKAQLRQQKQVASKP